MYIQNNSTIDRDSAIAQIQLLGYSQSDPVYFRAIKDGSAQKIQAKNWDKIEWKRLQSLQNQGFNLYLVVNGCDHRDAGVTTGKAIFYEHDNLDIELQITLWQSLGLPEPSFQILTSNKSVHSYWVFDNPIPIEQWKSLQNDLLEFSNADRSIKNPSRVMRLAGSIHQKTGQPAAIVSQSGKRYTFEGLRAIVPATVTPAPVIDTDIRHTAVLGVPPLEIFLTREHRDFIQSGVSEGGRNSCGAALSRDLIGVSQRLTQLGIDYSGDPLALFEIFCARCSPPLREREVQTIWRSAQKDNPTATLTDDALQNCYKSWLKNQHSSNIRSIGLSNKSNNNYSGKSNCGDGGNGGGLGEVSLRDRLLELLSRNLKKSDFEISLIELSKSVSRPLSEIKNLADTLASEINIDENRQDTLKELDSILASTKSNLNLESVIPNSLAKPIKLLATTLNLRPECYLTTLLSVTSSLFKTGTSVRLYDRTDFEVSPNIFSAIVAPPSQYKTPVFKAIATKPLRVLQKQESDKYKEILKQYEDDLNYYNSLSEDEQKEQGKPTPPPSRKRVLFYQKATSEALREQYAAYPNNGLLNCVDELKGMFSGLNQYRGGKGSDEEDLLSLYDGTGDTVLRVDTKKCADLPDGLVFGVTGGLQPLVLKQLLQDCSDANGKWARFNFVVQPIAPSQWGDDSGSLDLTPLLTGLYEKIDNLPATTYHLSPDAKRYFIKARNLADLKRCEDPRPGMQAVWGKVAGKLGKFALNLHVIHELLAGRTPSQEIPLERMQAAAELAKFYVDQVESLYLEFASPSELTPVLAKIVQLSDRKGWLKARDVQMQFTNEKRPTPTTVREWFAELVAMGRGQLRGEGRSIEFSSKIEFVGKVGSLPTNLPTNETFDNTSFQPFVGKVGKVGKNLEKLEEPSFNDSLVNGFVDKSTELPTIPTNTHNARNLELESFSKVGNSVDALPTNSLTPQTDTPAPAPAPLKEGDTVKVTNYRFDDGTSSMWEGRQVKIASVSGSECGVVWSDGEITQIASIPCEFLKIESQPIQVGDKVRIGGDYSTFTVIEIALIVGEARLQPANGRKPIVVTLDRLIKVRE